MENIETTNKPTSYVLQHKINKVSSNTRNYILERM